MSSPVLRALVNVDRDPALDVFLHWCDSKAVRPFPLSPADITVFVKQAETLGIEKIASVVAAISKAYVDRGLADPTAGGPVAAEVDRIGNVPQPASWPREHKALFRTLPYRLQVYLLDDEKHRARVVRKAHDAAAAARKELAAIKPKAAT